MNFPLDLRFKALAISQQLSVEDASGELLWYMKAKTFALREKVTIFGDREQTRPVYEINADRMIDVGATYTVTDVNTRATAGELRNDGMRSLWRARYEVNRGGTTLFRIHEENPWVKVMDGLLMEVPIVAFFSGYIFHPRYLAERDGGAPVMRIRKEAAFLEGRYSIERLTTVSPEDEKLLVLGIMMMVLLERTRG
jgi:uncharacterized protein YxjI